MGLRRMCSRLASVALIILPLIFAQGCVTRPAVRSKISEVSAQTRFRQDSATAPQVTAETAVTRSFPIGEYYEFSLKWVGIPVGTVSYSICGETEVNGIQVYVVRIRAKTNKFASAVYSVDDVFTSYVDKERLWPLRYDVNRKDGNYRKNAVTYFNHEEKIAYFENFVDGSKKTYPIPKGVLDPVSAILNARTIDIRIGRDNVLYVANNEKVYEMHGAVEKREIINIRCLGDVEAYFMSPYAVLNGERFNKGRVRGYISADNRRMLLYAEAKAPVFTVLTATLTRTSPDASGSSP
ncbi:MAG: DUF3108 domain-containing protein [Candidatus Omnitrophota bacterium]